MRPLQRLDGRLLVNAENDRFGGRVHIEADNIRGFGRKVRVVAFTPGLASREVNLVAAQEPPNILDVNIAQRSGSRCNVIGERCDLSSKGGLLLLRVSSIS